MPATPARIGFISQQFRTATSGPDSNVVVKYGEQARDVDEPVETFLDSMDDVLAVCVARHVLLKPDRRRFQQTVAGEDTALDLDYSQVMPSVTVIDDERMANFTATTVEVGVDFEKGQSILATWG